VEAARMNAQKVLETWVLGGEESLYSEKITYWVIEGTERGHGAGLRSKEIKD